MYRLSGTARSCCKVE